MSSSGQDVPFGATGHPTCQHSLTRVDSVDSVDSVAPVAAEAPAHFPPEPATTLDNWQEPSHLRWGFVHMREVVPSQLIAAEVATSLPLPLALQPVGHVELTRLDGSTGSLDEVLAGTHTDAFLMLQDGQVVEERYFGDTSDNTRHMVMSVSKSIVGCVAATLVEQGCLDPQAHVTRYVPEVAGSGYDGATVRNLLDMRTGVAFRETYTDPDAEVRVMERSVGWRPLEPGDPVGSYAYLTTLGTAGPHGGDFTYRSADTDMLGWVCERASGTRMAELISANVWVPMGAQHDGEIGCDAVGTALHDGGICATTRDLARFGQMLLQDGLAGGRRVVPSSWFAESHHPGDDVRKAFAGSTNEAVLPGGWYRNQFWFIPGRNGVNLVCLGIHGQMVHVNRATRTVTVKLSSWPDAQNVAHLVDSLRAVSAAGAYLAGLDGAPVPVIAAKPE